MGYSPWGHKHKAEHEQELIGFWDWDTGIFGGTSIQPTITVTGDLITIFKYLKG